MKITPPHFSQIWNALRLERSSEPGKTFKGIYPGTVLPAVVLFAGILILFQAAAAPHADPFSIEEELCIGLGEGAPEYMFSRISDIAVDNSGRIYVLDYMEAELRVFDEKGRYIRTVGGKGEGPGEFTGPFSLGITAKNSLMVHDLVGHRISYFSEDGDYISSISTADMIMTDSDVDSSGNIIGLIFTTGPEGQTLELKRFDQNKNTLTSYCTFLKRGMESANNPFGPDLHWTRYLEDQVICGYSRTYELRVYNLDGKKLRTITHDYRPVKITQDEVEALRNRLPAMTRIQTPKFRPAYQNISADEDGRIFVATWEKAESGKGYLYDVFGREGVFMTRIELDFPPVLWKDSKLYTIEEDREGYPVVKRYGVRWNR